MEKAWKNSKWIARFLIAVVTFLNLQAAFYFMFHPADYAPAFELVGGAAEAMIQGVGLLFLMWNIPYIVALIDPQRHFVSLIEAVVMQAIGAGGETVILVFLGGNHPVITASVSRFILFDGTGLLLLVTALVLIILQRKKINDLI